MKLQAVLCLLLLLVFELSSCRHFEVIPGSNLELPCLSFQDVYTGGTITWKFNGEDLSLSAQSPDSPRMKKGGMVLSVSPVTAASQGEYSCTIEENNLEMSSTYTIEVVHMIYTMKVTQGSTAQLQCHFPTSSQVTANALWFKVDNNGTRTQLDTEDESSDNRVNLLYPLDHDQTITIKNIVMEDSGNYLCESAGGQTLSSVYIIVQVAPTPVPHSCLGFTAAWEPCQDENSRTGEPILQESITEFSMKLYSYLRESQPSSNLLFSPISISGVLSHLLLGMTKRRRFLL